MINEEIKAIAGETNTSKVIFEFLSKRLRFRRETNLIQFHNQLMNMGLKVVEEEYIKTFKRLQELGVGRLVVGRRGKANRFIWNYNLKDIAKAASGLTFGTDIQKLDKPMRKPGRPRKETPVSSSNEPVLITLKITPEVKSALIDIVKKLVA